MTNPINTAPPVSRSAQRFLAFTHVTVDFYQGALPALVPILIAERGYSFAAAAAVVLASSLASSIIQPLFGIMGDRWKIPGIVPVAVALAGIGMALIVLTDSLLLTGIFAAISGVGVAAFHPDAAKKARHIAGDDDVVLSWFSLGGNLGFAVAPLYVGVTVGILGLDWAWMLGLPAVAGLVSLAMVEKTLGPDWQPAARRRGPMDKDNWREFAKLVAVVISRSIIFVATASFIVVFMQEERGLNSFWSQAALFIFYIGGAVGTLMGGKLARNFSRIKVIQVAYAALIPVFIIMLLVPGPLALVFVAIASLLFFVPFSLQVSLGQDYLPNNMGTAAGVTLGLAVSAGGVASPVVGAVADHYGLLYALLPLVVFPAAACVILARMKDPRLEN